MITVRADQIRAFNPVADEMFIGRLAQYLRDNHAATSIQLPTGVITVQDLPEETLRKLISHGLRRARTYELTHQSALAGFVALQFETAPNLDEHPLLRRVLKNESVEPNLRVDRLLEQATSENWQAVKERYDPAAWFGASNGPSAGEMTQMDASEPAGKSGKGDIRQGDTDGE